MRSLLAPLAGQDLESIADCISDCIAADDPRRATGCIQDLRQRCQPIALDPPGCRTRPEPGEAAPSCPRGHHVVFFEASADVVTVLRIPHGARVLPALLRADAEATPRESI